MKFINLYLLLEKIISAPIEVSKYEYISFLAETENSIFHGFIELKNFLKLVPKILP